MDEAAASDYERERQRNIEENKRMLASLGLTAEGGGGVLLPTAQAARSVKPKPARRSTLTEERPMRTSRRLQGLEPEGLKERSKKRALEAGLARAESAAVKTIRRGPVEIKSNVLSEEEQEAFLATLQSASKQAARQAASQRSEPMATAEIRSTASRMTIPSSYIQKVTKDRIYSLAFHPYVSAEGKAIVCAGDKWGQLGLYAFPVPGFTANLSGTAHDDDDDMAAKQEQQQQVVKKVKRFAKRRNRPQPAKVMEVEKNEEKGDEAENDEEKGKGEEDPEAGHMVSVYQPHSRVISGIVFSPVDHNKLYTSSYDGTLRCMDVDKNAFDLIYAAPTEELLTRVDVSGTGHELYFVTGRGDMKRRDLRKSEKKKVDVYSLHEKKAYCVHINRSNENQIVTSSGDGTVCVWDVRKLEEGDEPATPLATFRHRQSIASAFFSPLTGTKIVSTSYDDTICVWDVNTVGKKTTKSKKKGDQNSVAPLRSISHNNHTGRWLTPFQATWHPHSEDVIVVGDMKRAVDVIGTTAADASDDDEGEQEWWVRLTDEKMGTIPSLNAYHPTLSHAGHHPTSILASANASGLCIRVVLARVSFSGSKQRKSEGKYIFLPLRFWARKRHPA